ncbi:MAG TPA: glycosyltransferase [Thermoplasmata archaeon]
MRILMIVSNDVIHDSRVVKEARALRDAGHQIRFIGWDRTGDRPERLEWDGFAIRYVRTRGAMRAAGHDILRNPLWWRRALRFAQQEAAEVVHCHDLDTLRIGVRWKRSTGGRLVYDAHEIFGYMIEQDVPRLVMDYAFRMERELAPSADRVIAVNEAVKRYVDGIAARPATLVRNTSEHILDTYRPPPGGPFTVLYVGTLHPSRFLLPAIEVIGEMPDARLVLGGGKALASEVADACKRHPNTEYLGIVPNERVLPMTVDSHAVLSMFDPTHRINQVGLPNKIFEAMAAGRPSITTHGLPMGDLVEEEECGLAVPYSTEGFREAVVRLRDDPDLAERLGRNGLAAAKREYNWAAESRKLVRLYEDLEAAAAREGGP